MQGAPIAHQLLSYLYIHIGFTIRHSTPLRTYTNVIVIIDTYERYMVLVKASTAVGFGDPVQVRLYSQEGSKLLHSLSSIYGSVSLSHSSTEPPSKCY